ncbi:MAG: hypothetical protein ACHQ0J_08565 [Candidatus Dormibacterales bacterium]
MFLAAGSTALGFCAAAGRIGQPAAELGDAVPPGLQLLHLEARALLATDRSAFFREAVEGARREGALISIDLGLEPRTEGWIRAHGSPRTAYQLATIQPDILFASEAAAADLGAPLEGIAAVPVVVLAEDAGGCSVYGRRLAAPATGELDPDLFMAAFCIAFVDGEGPIEAAGRAVLATRGSLVAEGPAR